MKIIKAIFPFVDFLYVLQLEEYYSHLYLRSLPRFYFRRGLQRRERLVWTSRIQTTFLISTLFCSYPTILTFALVLLNGNSNWWLVVLVCLLSIFLIPIWILLTNIILSPVYDQVKRRIQLRAATRFAARNKDTKVVMISGSFGKTTTKNFLQQIIQHRFRTQMLPGNINTPTGIAVWVNTKLHKNTEILIVEADSDFRGKVKQCCNITPPDIAILTNIGDQHLLNFGGKFKNLAQGLTELFVYAKPNATLITTEETKSKLSNFDPHKPENKKRLTAVKATEFDSEKWPSNIDSPQAKQALQLAILAAQQLGLSDKDIKAATSQLELPDRRHKYSELHGFKIIDDSYNISLTTAKAGVLSAKDVAKKEKQDLILITGGLPDLAGENAHYNKEYGEWLNKIGKPAKIILLKTILHKEILSGLSEYDNVLFADSMQAAWKLISTEFKPQNYLVLMQPELNDLYY